MFFQNKSRIFIIVGAVAFLAIVGSLMLVGHLYQQRGRNVQVKKDIKFFNNNIIRKMSNVLTN